MSDIILLHGPSSAGKSTLARAVQARIHTPFWHYCIDHLRDSGVLPAARIKSGEFAWKQMRANFFEGFHRSVGSFADAGNNLIVEHIIDTPGWLVRIADVLDGHNLLFVGLHVRLDELNRRELERSNRPAGSAEADYHSVHKGMRYDLEIDAGGDVEASAQAVIGAWQNRPARSVFFALADEQRCAG